MSNKQPMAGRRQTLDIKERMETTAFANKRKKERKRSKLAKASRKKNRK